MENELIEKKSIYRDMLVAFLGIEVAVAVWMVALL